MMAAGRRPVDRIYDALMFADVGEAGVFYPMAHAAGVPHRVMSFSPARAKANWAACHHPLYEFVFETLHPDIDLTMSASMDFPWTCPETLFEVDSAPAPLSGFGPMSRYDYLTSSVDINLDTLTCTPG